jgi:fatty-acyl-CoA synthase
VDAELGRTAEGGAQRQEGRQGVRYAALEGLTVMDPETMTRVPADGETMGEVMFRGNIVMKGYLKNPKATDEAFAGGWFHSGDLGVLHPTATSSSRTARRTSSSRAARTSRPSRSRTCSTSTRPSRLRRGGKPDDKWGETPCAFVELKPGKKATADDIIAWCRQGLARYKVPAPRVFAELPKTSTGKIQKFKLRDMAKALCRCAPE